MPLVLRHASKRVSGSWSEDDYDVITGSGCVVGRIFKPSAGVASETPWMWTITGEIVPPPMPSYGYAATRDEAKAAFAETWRKALALAGRSEDDRPTYG